MDASKEVKSKIITFVYIGSWNIGSLTNKLMEIVDTTIMRRINIMCL